MLMTRQEIFDRLKEILVAADSGNKAIRENSGETWWVNDDMGWE